MPINIPSLNSQNTLTLPSDNYNEILRNADNLILNKKIQKLLNGKNISEEERKIIKMRYGFDKQGGATPKEVANRFNIHQSRVRQIEAKILKKIKPELSKIIK